MLKVFVYGTLKPGESNYLRYCAGKVVEEKIAMAYGQLFHLPIGYPAMTPGSAIVQGYLLTFANSDILRDLDELEDYDSKRSPEQNHYNRFEIEVFNQDGSGLGLAWVYLMTAEQVEKLGGVLLPFGWWTGSKAV
ncbi:gamma-glutamylcyclotransferase family protein [Argonema antarcticum]|uniref:gamma-glutamylcyclotransferase family protein n=1 Tax=Argonema antarcticum TaxID=2942763 RepID=UPI002011FFF1|nr:gamma-glutamylcyclotransferase [Argonema antarcticum]MCL1471697.1 gamma-glutamylcyclotransferase [Argonema antarcticum A004/B2]